VIDEAQDLGVPELKMLAAIIPDGTDALFFCGGSRSAYLSGAIFLEGSWH
jgi:hypothetical protein